MMRGLHVNTRKIVGGGGASVRRLSATVRLLNCHGGARDSNFATGLHAVGKHSSHRSNQSFIIRSGLPVCRSSSVEGTTNALNAATSSDNGVRDLSDAPERQEFGSLQLIKDLSDEESSDAEPAAYDGIIVEPTKSPTGLFVRVRGMVKHFNTAKGVFKAVDSIDVDIEPSSIVALLGPSGSGKTTLLRLIAGLEEPTGGQILFDDFDATRTSVQDRHIGFVFQSYALFNHKTVAENIKFGLEVRNVKVDHAQRVADLLQLVQLDGLGDRFPRQLSGGQRQRVAMARALASNPKLLLLDEPFGALDAVVRKSLRAGLKEIVRSVGVTTVIVTHDQEEAFDLADKVVIFNRGRVEQQGTPTEIIKSPRTPFIMKFVGETNIVPANCQFLKRMRFQSTKSKVMFRPSDILLFKTPQQPSRLPDGSVLTLAPAEVSERHNLGWIIKYTLTFDDGVSVELQATRQQDEAELTLEQGQRVFLHVSPKHMMAFEQEEIESAPLL